MSGPADHSSPEPLTAAWLRVLAAPFGSDAGIRPSAAPGGTPVQPGHQAAADGRLIEVSELFVRTDPQERRGLDLLCLALVAYAVGDREAPRVEFYAWGPQTLRAQSRSSLTGLTVVDLPVAPASAAQWTSCALLRVPRRPRTAQVTGEIVELADTLDFRTDPTGSAAVATALLDRVEILTTTAGVVVSVVQTVDVGTLPAEVETMFQLTEEGVEVVTGERGRGQSSRPSLAGPGRRNDDYIVLRIGPPRPRRTVQRSLLDLRRQHALVEIGEDPGRLAEAGSSAMRVSRARQEARARNVVQAVAAGELDAAVDPCREALRMPEELEVFREGLASRIPDPTTFWGVDDVIAAVAEAGAADPAAVAKLRSGLDVRLGQLLISDAPAQDSVDFIPAVLPIVVEFADDLVRHVDSNQDGGRFLYELIPWMRDRVAHDLGVTLPGVRLRGNPSLHAGGFVVQVDEVPVLIGSAASDAVYRVGPTALAPAATSETRPEQTLVHPMTGEHGAWSYWPVADEAQKRGTAPGGDVEPNAFGPPHYLIQKIELVLRSRLSAFLGPLEVDVLVAAWEESSAASGSTEPLDARARVRLTWVLQSIVEDQIPLRDGPAILRAVGAVTEPFPELRRAVRGALRADLPGREGTARRVVLPHELETALLQPPAADVIEGTHQAYLELLAWLRETADAGPAFTIVTSSVEARERVAQMGRAHYAFVTTLTTDELS